MDETLGRKYALTKIKAGDYLLPSNDGETIWRITRYEDGPSHGLDDWPRDETFWGLWRYTGKLVEEIDPEDWGPWAMDGAGLSSRADAIQEALRLSPHKT